MNRNEDHRIIPECGANTLLINVIIRASSRHAHGNTNALSVLRENDNALLAVLDDDPEKRRPRELVNDFHEIKNTSGIKLFKHNSQAKYVLLQPITEDWFSEMIGVAELSYTDFNIENENKFRQRLKKRLSEEDIDLERIMKRLINHHDPHQIQIIREWLIDLDLISSE
jgi:hypothetical protein